MIYDKICNIENYLGLSKNIDNALLFIKNNDIKTLPKGKTVIDNENVFVNHFEYNTVEESEDTLFENHIDYIDLHVVISGEEFMEILNRKEVDPSVVAREEKDTLL